MKTPEKKCLLDVILESTETFTVCAGHGLSLGFRFDKSVGNGVLFLEEDSLELARASKKIEQETKGLLFDGFDGFDLT